MLQRKNSEFMVIRANERKRITVPGNPMSYQELSPEHLESVAMFSATAAPNQNTGANALKHGGDEVLVVLSGRMEIEVEGRKELGPGDSAYIPRGRHHRLQNIGPDEAQAIFVLSPPKY